MPIPKILSKIQDEIKKSSVWSINFKNSSDAATKVFAFLEKGYTIEKAPFKWTKGWYGFTIEEGKEVYYVDIKVSKMKRADNISKAGLYHVLTGETPSLHDDGWKKFLEALEKNMKPNECDYYFLVFPDGKSAECFIATLRTLAVLTPNGNNLPFQCKWSPNRTPVQRNYATCEGFLMSNFRKSLELRAATFDNFKKKFGKKGYGKRYRPVNPAQIKLSV